MDNSGSIAQTDTLAPLSDIAVKSEAGLDLANPAKLVEKQSHRRVQIFCAAYGKWSALGQC
jgi:hypothetical protein